MSGSHHAAESRLRTAQRRGRRSTPQGADAKAGVHDIELRTCDEILAIVSHDLRAPLLTITTCAHALQRSPEDVGTLSVIIDQAAEWSRRLVDDLLDVTLAQTGRLALQPEPVSVARLLDLVGAIFRPLAADADVTLDIAMPQPDIAVTVDDDRIVQAIGNLVANAVRVAPPGSTVRVTVDVRPRSFVVRVSDEGPGISRARLKSILDRRQLRHDPERQGTGLGLAIAQGILAAHGGRLTVTSTVGKGSVFSCHLPRRISPIERR